MLPNWSLKVEGLGKLAHAEVKLRPLMLFVGENNSGKSYLASLLWGLCTDRNMLLPVGDIRFWHEAVKWLRAQIKKASPNENLFNDEGRAIFEKIIRSGVQKQGTAFIRYILNNKSIESLQADVCGLGLNSLPAIRLDTSRREPMVKIELGENESSIGEIRDILLDEHLGAIQMQFFCRSVAGAIWFGDTPITWHTQSSFNGYHGLNAPIYLPASRTGFMLLYRSVASNLMNRQLFSSGEEKPPLELALPTIQFLNLLATGIGDEVGPYAEEADFLEQALRGRVEKQAGVGLNDFRFRFDDSKAALPMNLASSLVTELSPIILVLKHMDNFPVLILEEPEAHLHPKLQRKLAQVVVRLIRKGLWVWITTHSENFCQQINNFIKIGALSDRLAIQQKFGYAAQDFLNLDEVAGYQFELDESGEKAFATEVPKSEQGLVMRSFNRELRGLARETQTLQEAVNKR